MQFSFWKHPLRQIYVSLIQFAAIQETNRVALVVQPGEGEVSMKAVVYQGPFSVSVEEVPDPELQHPNDVIVKIYLQLHLRL